MQARLDRHVVQESPQDFGAFGSHVCGRDAHGAGPQPPSPRLVSSFKVDNLSGSKGSGGKKKDSQMINAWGATFIAAAHHSLLEQ